MEPLIDGWATPSKKSFYQFRVSQKPLHYSNSASLNSGPA
jgi:hypothetical protein